MKCHASHQVRMVNAFNCHPIFLYPSPVLAWLKIGVLRFEYIHDVWVCAEWTVTPTRLISHYIIFEKFQPYVITIPQHHRWTDNLPWQY